MIITNSQRVYFVWLCSFNRVYRERLINALIYGKMIELRCTRRKGKKPQRSFLCFQKGNIISNRMTVYIINKREKVNYQQREEEMMMTK
jgi:hypothetical protein